MAALLVSLAVMSVLLSVILPTWHHEVQREKEAELVFRGEQYARAVALYRAKNANAFPPNVDVLVQGRFLRKKYLDPITKKDFDVIGVGVQSPTQGQGPGTAAGGRGTGAAPAAPASTGPATGVPGAVSGGIMGVHSKSQETSIRIYKGQSRYDQWNFVFTALNRPGGNVPGAANPGGRGGASVPGGRGGRGSGSGIGTDSGRGGRGTGRGSGTGQGGFELPPTQFPPAGGQRGTRGGGSDLPVPDF